MKDKQSIFVNVNCVTKVILVSQAFKINNIIINIIEKCESYHIRYYFKVSVNAFLILVLIPNTKKQTKHKTLNKNNTSLKKTIG